MAITQNDFSTQPGGAVPGQSGDTSPQINDALTVAEGSEFTYGDIAVSSASGQHYVENMKAGATFFEGVVARFFRKGNRSMMNNAPYEAAPSVKFTNPDTVTLSIFGRWGVLASEAITAKGQAAVDENGNWVEAKVGAYAIQGATYETLGGKDEVVFVRLTGGRLITLIEAAA
ncbi:TPA: hypothetical protein VGT17_005210 [Vibrio harveyi]|nr:hypothetical protein [Vibrio harveyi]HEQ3599242.1 hypothetical protein [Vibrio harveyi]HEQ3611300.1 hypothetical protein [Vibrio harveyi]